MESVSATKSIPKDSLVSGKLLLIAAILAALTLAIPVYLSQTVPPGPS